METEVMKVLLAEDDIVNLTPAGPLKDWSDGEIFRAIRNGIDRDGQVLFAMSGARGPCI